jgi:hypothetical protein
MVEFDVVTARTGGKRLEHGFPRRHGKKETNGSTATAARLSVWARLADALC